MTLCRETAYYYGRPAEQTRTLHFRPVSILFLSFFLFSLPNLSGRRLDVYHISTHDVVLVRICVECRSEMYCTRLAENTGRRKDAKNRYY